MTSKRPPPSTRPVFFALLIAALLLACGGPAQQPPRLEIFAAASLRDVVSDLAADFERAEAAEVVLNFAGSNTLAQQIDAAPGADLFLSADRDWIDFLDARGRTVAGTRRDVLSNRLVLIAHRDAVADVDELGDLATAEYRFLALADPQAVPAGRYARRVLERSDAAGGGDLWSAVADRVAPALDVRAALALVESDPEIFGIVYRTDARSSSKVRVLHELPELADAPITYCATLIAGGGQPRLAGRFLDFLTSPEAAAIAERHGFLPVRQ